MKIGDLVEIAWSLPQYAPSYNGKRGVVVDITGGGHVLYVSLPVSSLPLPIPNDCVRVITALDQLAEIL
jgi:hypothetical protein